MEIIKYPNEKDWPDILKRPAFDTRQLDNLVKEVVDDVRINGDKAVKKYTKKFDKASIDLIRLNKLEIDEAVKRIPQQLKDAIQRAQKNIEVFHRAQLNHNNIHVSPSPGVVCWQKPVPISKIGLYIPGGTAPLFSTVLMLGVPAKISGCDEIILCSPPDGKGKINDAILYAAHAVGINKIYKVGGVQAIAALAYGTETIPKVFKIFGPGNRYVTAAKQLVSRDAVAIDMPAGPSEVAVVADETSNPAFIASDLLAQAEHGTDSQVILFTTSENQIIRVGNELEVQLAQLPKKNIVSKSLENSKIIFLKDLEEVLKMVNAYAPEHLIILSKEADSFAEKVVNAGSVFIGEYTPESAGDYASGTNHTLPTHGWATSLSGVNMDSFFKKITYQKINAEGLENIGPAIEVMAEAEELMAHRNAVSVRLKKIREGK